MNNVTGKIDYGSTGYFYKTKYNVYLKDGSEVEIGEKGGKELSKDILKLKKDSFVELGTDNVVQVGEIKRIQKITEKIL